MSARYTVPGPCSLAWGALGSEVDLGTTKAGVIIRPTTGMVPIIDDEHGTEPADYIRAGKSCIVEAILNNATKYKAALAAVATTYPALFSIKNSSTPLNKIGGLANNGDGGTQMGRQLLITERDTNNLWKAKFTLMSDPQQLLLSSTQELLLPITFVVALDDDDKLFWTVPSYMR